MNPYELWRNWRSTSIIFTLLVIHVISLTLRIKLKNLIPRLIKVHYYYEKSKAYKMYNLHTLIVEETINARFDNRKLSDFENDLIDM